jgi:hypothetical protein
MMVKSSTCLLFLCFIFSDGKSVKDKTRTVSSHSHAKAPKVETNADAFKYLDKFGYNKCSDGHGNGPLCQSSFESMIEHFQTIFRLPVTGKLDKPTITLMNKPRCSLGDYPMSYSAFHPW